MFARYCIWTLLVLVALPAAAQEPQASPASRGYTIFVRGTPIGREEVTVRPDAAGITVTVRGYIAAQVNILTRRAEIRYRPDWTPEFLVLDATIDGGDTKLKTSFVGETAASEGILDGQPISHTDAVPPQTFVLPNMVFAAYEALARRLDAASVGAEHRAFLTPRAAALPFGVRSVTSEHIQTGASAYNVRRHVLVFVNPTGTVDVNVYTDESGSLLRVNMPAQGLDVVRDDLAASTARTVVHSNPGDEPAVIPSAGFSLGATLTRPSNAPPAGGAAAAAPAPAVILVGTSEVGDRDGAAAGVAVVAQLAGALADGGFLAVRYDQRGHGQSGGRAESATVSDLAEDVQAVVKWLAARRDVDRNRIAVLGYGDGAWVALRAASRERRIAAVVTIAAPAVTGAELVLEQQRMALDRMNALPTDREEKIALQSRINAAVMSGRGWEGLPADVRRQADTPWFQSFLAFNPAKALEDVRQPLLFVHGALDRQIPVSHVERIADIARTESDSKSVSVVTVRGVNHLLVPATTGEVSEYPSLQDRNVSRDVTAEITKWLGTALVPRR